MFIYETPPPPPQYIEEPLYREIVDKTLITCVDILVFSTTQKTYLLVKRLQEPAKGIWWTIGGRVQKGESFEGAAQRKCRQEVGIENIHLLGQVGPTYMTCFPTTQTANTVFLATIENEEQVQLDKDHEEYQWVPIAIEPEDPYVKAVYSEALKILREKKLVE